MRGSLPAIALTGFAAAEDSARAVAADFQAHVAKPFDMSTVCQLIARLAAGETPEMTERPAGAVQHTGGGACSRRGAL